MTKRKDLKKIMVIGSGPIIIGQNVFLILIFSFFINFLKFVIPNKRDYYE